MKTQFRWWLSLLLALVLVAPGNRVVAEHGDEQRAHFSEQELAQMLAPIALYPDNLLAQILMAATYPLEVAEAARWSRAHDQPTGNDAVAAVQDYDWDPSVQSLVAFPHILLMMDDKLDWTENLGDAFIGQPEEVMDTVQYLRRRAQEAGYFDSNDHVRVVPGERIIVVEPADPEVIYVPYYNPRVVYGTWWWSDYPPVYWDPWPGYRPHHHDAFAWGLGIGVGVGFFFGAMDWHHHHVYVDHNHHHYREYRQRHRDTWRHYHHDGRGGHAGRQVWAHQPSHRRGAPYHNHAVERRYSAGRDLDRHGFNQRPASQRPDSHWRVNDPRRGNQPSNRNARPTDGDRPDHSRPDHSRPDRVSPDRLRPDRLRNERDERDRDTAPGIVDQRPGREHRERAKPADRDHRSGERSDDSRSQDSRPAHDDSGRGNGLQRPRGRDQHPVAPRDHQRPGAARPDIRAPDAARDAARDRARQRLRDHAPDVELPTRRIRAEHPEPSGHPQPPPRIRANYPTAQPRSELRSRRQHDARPVTGTNGGELRARREAPQRATPQPRHEPRAPVNPERARQPRQASEDRRAPAPRAAAPRREQPRSSADSRGRSEPSQRDVRRGGRGEQGR